MILNFYIYKYPIHDTTQETRQDKTARIYIDKARQDKTRQGKTRQDKTRQDKTRQDKTRQDKTAHIMHRQDKTRTINDTIQRQDNTKQQKQDIGNNIC